jgi:hypothetical protein
MSQQGPILVVSRTERPALAEALKHAQVAQVIEANWADAARAIKQLNPAAVIVSASAISEGDLTGLASAAAARPPYIPLIAVDPATAFPESVLPFGERGAGFERLVGRLRAALRVRTLHATVMRRADKHEAGNMSELDLRRDASVLLMGRSGTYPALSVALGERIGVVGALSVEAAAKHLSTRDIDGIVVGDGFTPRVIDAFLTVLAEDSRFRNLPVVVVSDGLAPNYDLPNLEVISGGPAEVAAHALPLIRQRAFEAQLSRTLRSIDAGGLIDARTGLLTWDAFSRDFTSAVSQTIARGGGLSVARFAFDPAHPRAQLDGARIISRLMRQMDFGSTRNEGSVIVVFAETDLRTAHAVARRLSAVMRHTVHGKRDTRAEPIVSVATLMPSDTARSLLARVWGEPTRATVESGR